MHSRRSLFMYFYLEHLLSWIYLHCKRMRILRYRTILLGAIILIWAFLWWFIAVVEVFENDVAGTRNAPALPPGKQERIAGHFFEHAQRVVPPKPGEVPAPKPPSSVCVYCERKNATYEIRPSKTMRSCEKYKY